MKNIYSWLLALISLNALAQENVMTPQKLWELGRVSLETVSPDNKEFIFGLSHYDIDANKGNRDLYSMSTAGGEAKQLTNKAGGEYGAFYLMKGSKIGYSSAGQFHIMDKDGSNVKTLTDIEGGIGNIKAYDAEDGGIILVFTKSVKLEKTSIELYPNLPKAEVMVIDNLMYRHWDSWSDAEFNHICYAYLDKDLNPIKEYTDIMPNEKFDSPVNPFGGSESFTLSPDRNTIVYEAKKLSGKDWAVSTNSELYSYDIGTKKTQILTEGMMGYDKEPKFSPDGKKLAWMSMATAGFESDVNDIIIYDLKTKSKKAVLKESGLYDDYTFNSFSWNGNNSFIAGIPTAGSNQIFSIDLKKLSKGKSAFKKLSSGDHNYNHFDNFFRSMEKI